MTTDKQKRIKRVYGLDPNEYKVLLEMSDGKCWICAKEKKEDGRALHIDHSHKTLEVRGILCWQCNKGIQLFRDNPEFLRNAADYLEKPPTGFTAPPKRRKKRKKKKPVHINKGMKEENHDAA